MIFDGVTTTLLTTAAVKEFWEQTLTLAPKHINVLCAEGITHPKDLEHFDSKEFESAIASLKGNKSTAS